MRDSLKTFNQLGLSPQIMKALGRMGFNKPTPVQAQTIPLMMDGVDVIVKAPTGTGKTSAFGIPIIEGLDADITDIQAAIICPTRELCIQIAGELRELTAFLPDVRIASVYGGQPIIRQLNMLKKHPQIIVATPGRLLDHIGRGTIWLGNAYTVVLDEADEMLKMGFIKDVRKILNTTPADTQVVMFSATISRDVMDVAWEYQHNSVEVTISSEGENRPQIAQFSLMSSGGRRVQDILNLIHELDLHRVMVFCNMKSTVRQVKSRLIKSGCSVECLHGDIPQSQRNRVMSGFRNGEFEVLVATDVAARGIDVDDVEAVFNYDIPEENEYYIHRIGRTGRAKRNGMAFTFTTPSDCFHMRDIKKYTRSDIIEIKYDQNGTPALKNGMPLKDAIENKDFIK